ncbi:MAG: porin family protein [Chloroherpetonaceae bacterium]|nr:porin family protein [Chloroherpetonaceae bacterium]
MKHTRSIFFGLLFFFLGFQPTQAQIKFEPNVGINLGVMSGNLFSSMGTSQGYLGYQAGVKASITMIPFVDLHAELVYTRSGDTREVELQSVSGNEFNSNQFALSYFSLPFGATYSLTRSLKITGGLYGSILSSASLTSTRRNASGTTEVKNSVTSEFETVDYGAFLGVGLSFFLSICSFGILTG